MKRHVAVTQKEPNLWETLEPVVYAGWWVPAGYDTDFASVPRLLWTLVPRFGSYTAATVLHDWLLTSALPEGNITSREVDRLFRSALEQAGVSWARRWLMWTGVRWGAVANPARRPGIMADLPAMLGLSLLALPVVAPSLAVLPSLLIMWILDRMT